MKGFEFHGIRAQIASKLLEQLVALLQSRKVVVALVAVTNLSTQQTKTFPMEGKIMSDPIKDDSLGLDYKINWADADGQPAAPPTLTGPIVWSEDSNGVLAVLTPAADGNTAQLKPTGKGLNNVTVTANAPPSTDGVFAGAIFTDIVPIVADEATAGSLSSTPTVPPAPAAAAAKKKP